MSRHKYAFESILLSGLVFAAMGCEGCMAINTDDEPTSTDPACEVDVDCFGGEVCEGGLCVSARQPGREGELVPSDGGGGGSEGEAVDTDSVADPSDAGSDQNDAGSGPDEDAGTLQPGSPSPWLLSVNGAADTLVKIDPQTGESSTICNFAGDANYPSTTFGLDGTLYGFEAVTNSLDIIDPCTCEVTRVGQTRDAEGFVYDNIPGITANGEKIERLFGLSTDQDKLLDVENATGQVRAIGALGVDFDYSGTTWSVELGGLYAVNNTNDMLYTVDTESGLATERVALDIDVHLVGIEYHSANNRLYVCTNGGVYEVDVQTGSTVSVATLDYPCNNLAAPWNPVACIDNLP